MIHIVFYFWLELLMSFSHICYDPISIWPDCMFVPVLVASRFVSTSYHFRSVLLLITLFCSSRCCTWPASLTAQIPSLHIGMYIITRVYKTGFQFLEFGILRVAAYFRKFLKNRKSGLHPIMVNSVFINGIVSSFKSTRILENM